MLLSENILGLNLLDYIPGIKLRNMSHLGVGFWPTLISCRMLSEQWHLFLTAGLPPYFARWLAALVLIAPYFARWLAALMFIALYFACWLAAVVQSALLCMLTGGSVVQSVLLCMLTGGSVVQSVLPLRFALPADWRLFCITLSSSESYYSNTI